MITEVLPRTVVTTLATVPWAGPRLLLRLHDRGYGFDTVTWAEFAAAVARERPSEVSVDVYDTCLIRDLAGHKAIEEAIAHRRAMAAASSVPAADHAEELERELCRPVPGAQEALKAIRAVVGSVTFVSDTDRSAALLKELLGEHGLFVDGDRLFASCEEAATKADGDLFTRIWPRSDVESVWHLGNHPWADVTMAAAAGLRPFHLVEADLNRYEIILANKPEGEGPAVAAAARRVRLELVAQQRAGSLSEAAARARLIGAGVAGQAFGAFNLWVSQHARELELTSLGYLARDGELPLRLARKMPDDHWAGVSLRYLHCSRLSWGVASASAVGIDTWLRAGQADDGAFLLTQRNEVPLATLMARIGFDSNDLLGLGKAHATLARRPLTAALPVEADMEWRRLLDDSRVAEIILERSEQRRRLVVDYLAAQGMMNGRVGLVDVGWRGRLAWHVSSIMRAAGAVEPVHLHFGGDKIIKDVDRQISIERFAFQGDGSDETALGWGPVASRVTCVETLTAADKPRVVDYRRADDGSVDLIYQPNLNGHIPDCGDGDRADLWAGAVAVAALIPSRRRLTDWGVKPIDLGPDVRHLLGRWWNRPAFDEVTSIAHLRFEHDEAGSAYLPLVTPYSWEDVGRQEAPRRAWVRGSEIMTPRTIRLAVAIGRRLKDSIGRLFPPGVG